MAVAYKILGQGAPTNTSNLDIITVGSAKSQVISTIVVANVTATAATARIFARIAGAAAAAGNAIVYDTSVPGNTTITLSIGATLTATDILTVRTGTANALTFTAFGSEVS